MEWYGGRWPWPRKYLHVGYAAQTRGGIEDGQQLLLFLNADLQIGGDGVGELGRLVHAHGGDDGLVIERLLELDVLLKQRSNALHELLDGRGHLELGFAGAHGGDEEAVAVADVNGLGPHRRPPRGL